MGRLVSRLFVLLVLLSLALALGATGVYGTWWYGVIGAGIFAVFLMGAAGLIPSAMSRLREDQRRTGSALLQAFGALCVLEVLIMGLVVWAYGNRSLSGNNAYEVLGLLIFLGLIGVGIQGAIATAARFAYVRNQEHQPTNRRLTH